MIEVRISKHKSFRLGAFKRIELPVVRTIFEMAAAMVEGLLRSPAHRKPRIKCFRTDSLRPAVALSLKLHKQPHQQHEDKVKATTTNDMKKITQTNTNRHTHTHTEL